MPLDGRLSDYQHPDPLPIAHPDTVRDTDAEVRAVCLRAAEIIEQRGWWQGGFGYGPKFEACMGRAIQEAGGIEKGACLRLFGIRGIDIPDWNDAPDRTVTEVLALLRGTAGR